MVIKQSRLFSFLWSKSNLLRGDLDVDRFKDYVLTLLFVKYATDRFAAGEGLTDRPDVPLIVPPGAGFRELVALKGHPEIGRRINDEILAPLAAANGLSDLPDFNDASQLGVGPVLVERLTKLIEIFENEALDFSTAALDADADPLGDAYEYLMRYCPASRTERGDHGKRGEHAERRDRCYTPAEVSRVMAQVLGLDESAAAAATVYDPVCGFGSPLVGLSSPSRRRLSLFVQSGDSATGGLARMHMRLRDGQPPSFALGDTFAAPQFRDGDKLRTFDFVLANPPLERSDWCVGLDPLADPFKRFQPFGAPPEHRSSYAYLLHVVQSLNPTGRGVCVLPQRVLSRGSRGDVEAEIRWALVRKGLISGLIGLPPNLFFGTGRAMSLVVVDRRDAFARKGIFMIDAGGDFVKDGRKNRLRDCDVQRIAATFQSRLESPHYARMVSIRELAASDYKLDVAHYIERSGAQDGTSGAVRTSEAWPNSATIVPSTGASLGDRSADSPPKTNLGER
jgi:type I restriction enzyme M protein